MHSSIYRMLAILPLLLVPGIGTLSESPRIRVTHVSGLSAVKTQQENPIALHLHNPTGRAIAIVGLPGTCGEHCCISSEDSGHRTIPPGATVAIPARLRTGRQPGPFAVTAMLYLDDAGRLDSITHVIQGESVP